MWPVRLGSRDASCRCAPVRDNRREPIVSGKQTRRARLQRENVRNLLTRPPGSLGRLGAAGHAGGRHHRFPRPRLARGTVVTAADQGVVEQSVSRVGECERWLDVVSVGEWASATDHCRHHRPASWSGHRTRHRHRRYHLAEKGWRDRTCASAATVGSHAAARGARRGGRTRDSPRWWAWYLERRHVEL
jgi:hypothetical protein